MFARLLLSAATFVALALPATAGAQAAPSASGMPSEAVVSQGPGDSAGGAIRLTVSPARATVGRRTRFRFTATTTPSDDGLPPRIDCTARGCTAQAGGTPVSGAKVKFAGRTARTDARGRVTISATLRRVGTFTARATKPDLDPGSTNVRAVRRRRGGGGQTGGSGCRDQRRDQRSGNRAFQRCERIGVSR